MSREDALFRQGPLVPGIHCFPNAAIYPKETERFEIFGGKRLSGFEIDAVVEHGYKFLCNEATCAESPAPEG